MIKSVHIHNPKDFEGMRKAGRLAAQVLDYITDYVVVGATTQDLNDLCHDFIIKHNAIPAPLNYKGFPKSICTSVNHVVCHGIPSDKKNLNKGDIINIDVTVILDGYYGDTSRMYCVDKAPVKAANLINVTYDAMMLAIEKVKPGVDLNIVGKTIQEYVHAAGFSVVRDFCGHGIGKTFHAPPNVLHYYDSSFSLIMEPGMFFTVEPMINAGRHETITKRDGWTATTKDKSLSAQFEHTIAVTETGYEIFTLSPKGYTKPPYT